MASIHSKNMKIKILELNKHRNETTFRPYINLQKEFEHYNIFFTNSNKEADLYFVGQSSIMNKKVSLNESIEFGIKFLKDLDKPYILFDGQDSSSLMGIWDVFKEVKGLKLVKNVILKNINDYNIKYPNGRWFWGYCENGYNIPNDEIQDLKSVLVSSGTNWLNTYGNKFQWDNTHIKKKYDVCVLIGLSKENYEFDKKVDHYYNDLRKKLYIEVNKLPFNCITTEKIGKLNKQDYFNILKNSRFCISPFGYGEVNIREIECMLAGTDIIKPNISNIITYPNVYGNKLSYTCKNDFSDIKNIIENNIESSSLYDNQRNVFDIQSNEEFIIKNLINTIFQ
jgi:hypothetical protein